MRKSRERERKEGGLEGEILSPLYWWMIFPPVVFCILVMFLSYVVDCLFFLPPLEGGTKGGGFLRKRNFCEKKPPSP